MGKVIIDLEKVKKAEEIISFYGENNREFIDSIFTTLSVTKYGRKVLKDVDAKMEICI